jgi:hypothetical protein
MNFISSLIASSTFFALTTPEANKTPSAPKSMAALTSSPLDIPAPHKTLTSLFISLTA